MKLKEAFRHLIQGGWQPPNRMFVPRFEAGQITDYRLREVLMSEGYEITSEELWKKKIVPK